MPQIDPAEGRDRLSGASLQCSVGDKSGAIVGHGMAFKRGKNSFGAIGDAR
ncbi:MAG: hypothetical protein ACXV7J_16355 [Methylomonas sp.]